MTITLVLVAGLTVSGLPGSTVRAAAAPRPPLVVQMTETVERTLATNARREVPRRFTQRDPVADGALKGVVAGAIAGAAAWYGICRVMDDSASGTGDCTEPEMGIFAAAGALIGGLVGIGVDAARPNARGIRLTFRF